jgi:hypothetical protein
MSAVFDLMGIGKAMTEAASFIKAEVANWRPDPRACGDTLELQRDLTDRVGALYPELAKIPELKAWARMKAEELNEILKSEGFEIQLDPWPHNNDHFGVVSILDVTVKWLVEGNGKAKVYLPAHSRTRGVDARQSYPAFTLDRKDNQIEFFEPSTAEKPLIKIPTQSGDVVWIQQEPMVRSPKPFELYDVAEKLQGFKEGPKADRVRDKYARTKDVTIPKVKLRKQVDIGWMKGMRIFGELGSKARDPFVIEQALQEVRFVMNEKGARAKTATAMGIARSISLIENEHVVVDGEFLFWIERPGISTPLFVGNFTPDDWQDPGSLDNV